MVARDDEFDPSQNDRLLDPDYDGENNGGPTDPTVHWLADADGPIRLKVNEAYGTQKIDGAFDTDYFAVELKAGREYVFHVRGASSDDGTLEDPFIFGMWKQDYADGDGANTVERVWRKRRVNGYDEGDDNTNGHLNWTRRRRTGSTTSAWQRKTGRSILRPSAATTVEVYDLTADAGDTRAGCRSAGPSSGRRLPALSKGRSRGALEMDDGRRLVPIRCSGGHAEGRPFLITLASENLGNASITVYDADGNALADEDVSVRSWQDGAAHVVIKSGAGADRRVVREAPVSISRSENAAGEQDVGSLRAFASSARERPLFRTRRRSGRSLEAPRARGYPVRRRKTTARSRSARPNRRHHVPARRRPG